MGNEGNLEVGTHKFPPEAILRAFCPDAFLYKVRLIHNYFTCKEGTRKWVQSAQQRM